MSVGRRSKYILSLLASAALLFAIARFVDLRYTLHEFLEYPWLRLSLALTMSTLYYLVKALRWHYLLSVVEVSLPLRRSVLTYLAGQWFVFTPAGEFVRAYLLTSYGYRFSRGAAVVGMQILFDFLALSAAASAVVLRYHSLAEVVLPFTAILFVGTLLFALVPRFRHLWTRGAAKTAVSVSRGRWADFYNHSQQLVSWRCLIVSSAMSLTAVMIGAALLYEVFRGHDIEVSFGQAGYVYTISQIAGGLSMLPHGLGAVEGSSIALAAYAGINLGHAAAAIALFRLVTLGWSAMLGGAASLLLRTRLAGPPVRVDAVAPAPSKGAS